MTSIRAYRWTNGGARLCSQDVPPRPLDASPRRPLLSREDTLILDLVLFLVATYGAAWLVAKAGVTRPLRDALTKVPTIGTYLSHLVACIVCTGCWCAVGLAVLLPRVSYVSSAIQPQGPVDFAFLVFLWVGTGWPMAVLLKDAE